jgi:hypothetical protein
MDIEGAFWWNVDGGGATLRYRSVVDGDVAECSGRKKLGRIEYSRLIIGIGDPEDGWLIAPQCHLTRLEFLSGDADLDQRSRRPIDCLSNRWILLARRLRGKQRPAPGANRVSASSKGAFPFRV